MAQAGVNTLRSKMFANLSKLMMGCFGWTRKNFFNISTQFICALKTCLNSSEFFKKIARLDVCIKCCASQAHRHRSYLSLHTCGYPFKVSEVPFQNLPTQSPFNSYSSF